jgi:hypothetical protein
METTKDLQYTLETNIVNLFKANNKKCVYYNKEDPTNYEKFYS